MHEPRRLMLLGKAQNYIDKLKANEFTPDGKAGQALLYQIDAMIYGLASINTSDWQEFLKELKGVKYLLRIHSKDENVKRDNYNKAAESVMLTLDKYVVYLEELLKEEVV